MTANLVTRDQTPTVTPTAPAMSRPAAPRRLIAWMR